jgi:hypothetical protein
MKSRLVGTESFQEERWTDKQTDMTKLLAILRTRTKTFQTDVTNTVETGYSDIGLCDTLFKKSASLWYQLIPHC